MIKQTHSADVLNCLANLSSDEVFTSPKLANQMLDMLPQELFTNPETTFLDPCTKSGVFLREIAKRLLVGLENKIPDLQQRINHIFTKQLFGIAITQLTSLLSRRSVYCSKTANGKYSIVDNFSTEFGNIKFDNCRHTWNEDFKCEYCGVNQTRTTYNRNDAEVYAYEFIHTYNPEELFNMRFDVIIGNPPYQLSDGGAQASATPIYNLFVEQAIKLQPRYLTMIIPSRWMTGGKGLDKFRENMLKDKRICVLHDYIDSSKCFTGVDIKGGVCYFLWNRENIGKCKIYTHNVDSVLESERYLVEDGDDIFIRDSRMISIKDKVAIFQEVSFENIVSPLKPYGLRGDTFKDTSKYKLPPFSKEKFIDGYSIIGLDNLKREIRYVPKDYPFPRKVGLDKFKIFVTRNYGCGEIGEVPATPVLATPGLACTETFIQIGPFDTRKEMENCFSYFKTKFFRMLVGICKQDQNASQRVYHYVPMQDFNKSWTDKELYEKYKLTQQEIDYIETNITPME